MPFLFILPQDIASVDKMKDASHYSKDHKESSCGANGVVVGSPPKSGKAENTGELQWLIRIERDQPKKMDVAQSLLICECENGERNKLNPDTVPQRQLTATNLGYYGA